MIVITNHREFLSSEGVAWRMLTSSECGSSDWKAKTRYDIFIPKNIPITHAYDFNVGDTNWGRVQPDGILIRAGYWWNLNTSAPDRWGKFASLPHDLIFQFSGCFYFPFCITRAWTNNLYYDLCEKPMALLYRAGLAVGSWYLWKPKPKAGEWVDPAATTTT